MPPHVPAHQYTNGNHFAPSRYPLLTQSHYDQPLQPARMQWIGQAHPQSPRDSFHSPPSPSSDEVPPTLPPRPPRSLEPDPLPPHSNPQALTTSQSVAFTDSKPIPPVRIDKDEVYSAETGIAQYAIVREAKHMPSLISTKPILTVLRSSDGKRAGQIKFRSLTTNSIEMTVNGRQTTLSHSYSLLHSQRWGFLPTTVAHQAEIWYWKKDRSTKGAMLEDSKHKHARCLARMKGDILKFEKGHLSSESYDEIVLSAIAMAEAARRAGKGNDIADIGASIGALTDESLSCSEDDGRPQSMLAMHKQGK